MATLFQLEIKDENNTVIQMEEAIEGRQANLYAFDFEVSIPINKVSGKIAGVREYQPFSVTKAICKASPIIFQKMCEGKKLKEATIKLYRHDPLVGSQKHFYSIRFKDLSITSQKMLSQESHSKHENFLPPLEKIEIIAEAVTMIYIDGNIEYTDEFRKNKSI